MREKAEDTSSTWTAPDDAPELTDEFFAQATPMIDGRVVSLEEFREAVKRIDSPPAAEAVVSIRLAPDVLVAFKSMGKGWQARINDALREWLVEHRVAHRP
jgi:uncharacterized protein (DUF4415 family)